MEALNIVLIISPQLYAALSDTQRNCFNVNELKQYVGIN